MTRENIAHLCPLTRKVCYRHRKRALGAAARLAAHLGWEKPPRVYKCRACRRYHMAGQIKESAR